MCALPQMVRPKGIMDIEMFKSIVDQSREFKMPIHNFHVFGDPLIYPKLEEDMQYFKKKRLRAGRVEYQRRSAQ